LKPIPAIDGPPADILADQCVIDRYLGAAVLEVNNLTVRYGPFLGVNDLALEVGSGEIVGVVGPNGAGKSSVVTSAVSLSQSLARYR